MEADETELSALLRELQEELGVHIEATSASHLCRVTAGSLDEPALLSAWLVHDWTGSPTNVAPEEHDAIGWFDLAELPYLDHEPIQTAMLAAMGMRRG